MTNWHADTRFQYGDPVHMAVKREGITRFPGYVVGCYLPMAGGEFCYVLEHPRTGKLSMCPENELAHGLTPAALGHFADSLKGDA